MKTSTVVRNSVSPQTVDLIGRLVGMIPWPKRRLAMGDVIITLLDGKPRVVENVFGWNRTAAELSMNECRTKILCIDDISGRRKPKVEGKYPKLLGDIGKSWSPIEPHCQAESHLRTTLLYSNMTAKAVYEAFVAKGLTKESLPTPPNYFQHTESSPLSFEAS